MDFVHQWRPVCLDGLRARAARSTQTCAFCSPRARPPPAHSARAACIGRRRRGRTPSARALSVQQQNTSSGHGDSNVHKCLLFMQTGTTATKTKRTDSTETRRSWSSPIRIAAVLATIAQATPRHRSTAPNVERACARIGRHCTNAPILVSGQILTDARSTAQIWEN